MKMPENAYKLREMSCLKLLYLIFTIKA